MPSAARPALCCIHAHIMACRLRISLGLKPLKIGGANDEEESARGRHMDAKRKKEQEARAQAFVAKKAE